MAFVNQDSTISLSVGDSFKSFKDFERKLTVRGEALNEKWRKGRNVHSVQSTNSGLKGAFKWPEEIEYTSVNFICKHYGDFTSLLLVQEERKRIPCPLNSNHNIYENDLKSHLKKCNVTKYRQAIEKLPYFVKDINKGTQDDCGGDPVSSMGTVKSLTSDRLGAMIEKVTKLYSDVVDNVEKLHLEHPLIKEEIVGSLDLDLNKAFGDQALLRKEMLQQASLVGQLDNLGFLSSGHCYIELGAGKGKLSHWIQKASEECVNNSFLLVERSSVRHKVDAYHKERGREDTFQRIKIDIQDLCLGKVPEIQDQESIVVVGKHLCGGATDLGIRCAVNTLNLSTVPSDSSHDSQSGQSPKSDVDHPHVSALEMHSTKIAHTVEEKSHENPAQTLKKENVTGSHKELSKLESGQSPKPSSQNIEDNNKYPCDAEGSTKSSVTDSHSEGDMEPAEKKAKLQKELPCKRNLEGVMIALCCHHRCTWDTYVGREFMRRHGVNEGEFDLLTRLSSWATCARIRIRGKNPSKEELDQKKDLDSKDDDNEETASNDAGKEEEREDRNEEHSVEDLIGAALVGNIPLRKSLSVAERENIGRKAKRIIDMGRIDYLRSKKLNCFLREYTEEDITPENIVLFATTSHYIKS